MSVFPNETNTFHESRVYSMGSCIICNTQCATILQLQCGRIPCKNVYIPAGVEFPHLRHASAPTISCLWLHESGMVCNMCKFCEIPTLHACFVIWLRSFHELAHSDGTCTTPPRRQGVKAPRRRSDKAPTRQGVKATRRQGDDAPVRRGDKAPRRHCAKARTPR